MHQETSIGKQFNSLKSTNPSSTFLTATRSQQQRLYFSGQRSAVRKNNESEFPISNSSAVSHSRVFSFPRAAKCTHRQDASSASTTDLLGILVDDQEIKYHKSSSFSFGTDSRGRIRNSAIIKNDPQASFGSHSPGPGTYVIPDLAMREGPVLSMGTKTKPLMSIPQTPENVGPGTYQIPTTCGGSHFLARIPNQPVCGFGKSKQRVDPSGAGRSNSTPKVRESLITDSFGPQADSRKRSGPRATIGSQPRHKWTASPNLRDMNKGQDMRLPHPDFPSRLELVKWS